jgi:hypothetical protein
MSLLNNKLDKHNSHQQQMNLLIDFLFENNDSNYVNIINTLFAVKSPETPN